MNNADVHAHWAELSPYISSKWTRLTGLDRELIQGRPERLVELLQTRYHINRVEAEQSVQALLDQID